MWQITIILPTYNFSFHKEFCILTSLIQTKKCCPVRIKKSFKWEAVPKKGLEIFLCSDYFLRGYFHLKPVPAGKYYYRKASRLA